MKAAVLAFVVAGCGMGGIDSAAGTDGGVPYDCSVGLSFVPEIPIAGPTTIVHVVSHVVGQRSVLHYDWHVRLAGAVVDVTSTTSDNSEIDFAALAPGTYDVSLVVTGAATDCPAINQPLDVRAPGAQLERLRLRVVPQDGAAPPFEQRREIYGGATTNLGIVSLESGFPVTAMVRGPSGGVPAYLRFAPGGAPGAVVEAFADATGLVTTRLLAQPHTVLIIPIPSASSSAPYRISGWSSSGATLDHLDIAAGAPITGTVLDPAKAPLAGAKVQLSIDGVPSTLATTGGDGRFAMAAMLSSGAAVVVEVTPPDGSGLPRLSATSRDFALPGDLQIGYAPELVRKDLAGTRVWRQGAAVANANVMVVGLLVAAGTVTAGMPASATGEVRVATRTDAVGRLSSVLVPSAVLSAVVTVAAGDLAVADLDTTGTVPATIDAPPMLPIATAIQDRTATELPGAVLDLVPAGALAMAAAPALHVTADRHGGVTASLASGGHYDLRFRDPEGRAAPLVVLDRVATAITQHYSLPGALQVTGTVMIDGTTAARHASVQVLCDACTGIDREKPIAEGVSNDAGVFTLAVPDPGTM